MPAIRRFKFTDRAVAAIESTGDRTEYADTEITGLRLRVSATGIKTFSLLRRVRNGPMERLTLGRFGDLKCEQVRTRANELAGLIAVRANPAEVLRAHKGEPTFAEVFGDYLREHAKPKKRSWADDVQRYETYLAADLAKKKVSRIKRADIAAIHAKITKDGHPAVANRVKALASVVFSYAMKRELVASNPAKGIASNAETDRERFLQPAELPKLFAALAAEPNQHFRDYFVLALLTGARRGNLSAMRWAAIDTDAGVWRIPGAESKNGRQLNVPLVPEALAILERRAADRKSEFVFPAQRKDSTIGHVSGERRAWLRILDRAGLSDVRIHDLRRTMGSWQARTGASLVMIGKTLGHKSQQATAIYARLDIDPVRQAMTTAASAMLEHGGVKPPAQVVPLKRARARKSA